MVTKTGLVTLAKKNAMIRSKAYAVCLANLVRQIVDECIRVGGEPSRTEGNRQ